MPTMGSKDTPPSSPGFPVNEDDNDELFEDDIDEEIPDTADDEVQGDMEDELDADEDELVELPGGIEQLEALIEEHENRVVDQSKVVFSKHSGSVFCCSLNISAGLVATGGEDDLGYVWNLDGEVQFTMEGWGDSVTCVAWNADSTMLAACDMAGCVKVWRVPGYQLVWSFDVGQDILWLKWHPVAAVLLGGTAEGQVWMWRLPGGDSKVMGGGERAECGEILGDGKRAVCGYSDGTVKLWDLRGGEVVHHMQRGHRDTVTNVLGHGGREVVFSASMDSTVNIWNLNSGKSVGLLMCGEAQVENSPNSVECLVVGQGRGDNTAVTGTLGGVVSVWDLSTQVSRCRTKVGEGITVLQTTENLVYCGTLEGSVRAVDIRTGAAANEWTGHQGSVLDMVLAEDEGTLVTASDDGTARVFDIRLPV